MTSPAATLRRARISDIISLRTLFVHALDTDFMYFPSSYIKKVKKQHSVARLSVSLLKKQRIVLLALMNRRIVGYMVGSGHPDGVGEVYWLYVHPSERRQRLGSKLLQSAVQELRNQGMNSIKLMTHQSEEYYAKHGFESVGIYKIDGLEVTIMQLSLRGEKHD